MQRDGRERAKRTYPPRCRAQRRTVEPRAERGALYTDCGADTQGLQAGDRVLAFADIEPLTAERLHELRSRVHEDEPVRVVVMQRDATGGMGRRVLTLTPSSRWPGQGLLGCVSTSL